MTLCSSGGGAGHGKPQILNGKEQVGVAFLSSWKMSGTTSYSVLQVTQGLSLDRFLTLTDVTIRSQGSDHD